MRQDEWQRSVLEAIGSLPAGRVLELPSLSGPARIPALAALLASIDRPTLVVTARLDAAETLAAELGQYLGQSDEPLLWPAPETLPYEQLPVDRATSSRRVELLARLMNGEKKTIVTPAYGLTQLLDTPNQFERAQVRFKVGQRIAYGELIAGLLDQGYELVPVVHQPGEVSRRGGIIDLFPPGGEHALRIDLFGDEIESLRLFDPDGQRSVRRLDEMTILPPLDINLGRRAEAVRRLAELATNRLRPEVADEWARSLRRLQAGDTTAPIELWAPYLLEKPASLLDYLPEDHLLILVEPGPVKLAIDQLESQAEELRTVLEQAGELPEGLARPYFSWSDLQPRLRLTRQVAVGSLPIGWSPPVALPVPGESGFRAEAPAFAGRLDLLIERIRELLADDWVVVLATEQSARTADVLESNEIFPRLHKEGRGGAPRPPSPGTVEVLHGRLEAGWQHKSLRLLLLSDREIYGYRHVSRPASTRRRAARPELLRQLEPGGFVVHIEHGIARYGGIAKLDASGVEREYLLLEYAQNDRLYLPVDQIDRITSYEGGGVEPKLTRLGSPEWSRTKQRVRQAVREMAFELLQLYAARETAETAPFPTDGVWDRELEESFPYTETPDQQRAITEVKVDLEQTRPMDRLVCGDVGYGKTEVALRAAFKAVNAGFQVALLVPTTVLALQHYHSFRDRLSPFPVKVEMLSRLRSPREQQAIVNGLRSGEIDIVIGTHRMIQKDVEFRRLGLLVIDEEQRFGVSHKEQLKRARTDVHVLTMTATPIPRTLHMALAGIRDLSVINTAPRDRTPIRTFVTPSNDALIREAILRELNRGGQVYFVHNRVQSIGHVLHHLRQLVPEARFGMGHGQMDEGELEQVMLSFVERQFDVLVCTTIIESGVDIPNVNTIIIDQAHRLGLTQLYQLRGRVGRSNHRAYAYLLYNANNPLSQEALARLEAIQEATELGAGFQIALRDLEIRGAGNILGSEQSGHIAAVGFDLYTRMLALAVEEVRAGRPIEEPEAVTVDLAIDTVIPDHYTGAEDVRIDLYRRLSAVRSNAELRDLQEEMIDRFGPMPDAVQRLVDLVRLRLRASTLGITSIVEREGEVYIRPVLGSRLNQAALRRRFGEGVTVTPNQVRLSLHRLSLDRWPAVSQVVEQVEEAGASVLVATAERGRSLSPVG